MARRIAVAVLALITVLLAVVAVPLGLLISAQDRSDFQGQTSDGRGDGGQCGRGTARRR